MKTTLLFSLFLLCYIAVKAQNITKAGFSISNNATTISSAKLLTGDVLFEINASGEIVYYNRYDAYGRSGKIKSITGNTATVYVTNEQR